MTRDSTYTIDACIYCSRDCRTGPAPASTDDMATTFPILRLPPELQVEVLKHHVGSFSVNIGLDWRSLRPSRLSVAALPKKKSCILYLCHGLREAAKQAVLNSFDGHLQLSLDNILRSFSDFLGPNARYRLPFSLPLERVRTLKLYVTPSAKLSRVFDDKNSSGWKPLRAYLANESRLERLEKIEVGYDNDNQDIPRITGDIRESTIKMYLEGRMDIYFKDWFKARLPQSIWNVMPKLRRAGEKEVEIVFRCTWIPLRMNGYFCDLSNHLQAKFAVEGGGKVSILQKSACYKKAGRQYYESVPRVHQNRSE